MKRIGSILVSLALALGAALFALPATALAAGGTPEIVLGADVLTKGHTIWFGCYENSAIQWRVLSGGADTDPDTALPTSKTGEALLISDLILEDDVYFRQDGSSNQWAGSDAQAWCTDLYDG